MSINCAAIPDSLFESEFFGHAKGAFTGAHAANGGKLQSAQGGTVLLDEIGDMTPFAQAKILRVIETKEVYPVAVADRPPEDERTLSLLIANAIADHARPAYREDVRCRKGAIVAGAGTVHGEHFTIDRWGLDESAWEATPRR